MRCLMPHLVYFLVALVCAPASAQESTDEDFQLGVELLQRGKDAYAEEDWLKARDRFERAYQAYPDAIALYYTALTDLKLLECNSAERNLDAAETHEPPLTGEALEGARLARVVIGSCRAERLAKQMRKGRAASLQGDSVTAIAEYRRAYEESSSQMALDLLIQELLHLDDCESALELLDEWEIGDLRPERALSVTLTSVERLCDVDVDHDGVRDGRDQCIGEEEDGAEPDPEDGCPAPVEETRVNPEPVVHPEPLAPVEMFHTRASAPLEAPARAVSEEPARRSPVPVFGMTVGGAAVLAGIVFGVVATSIRASTVREMKNSTITETAALEKQKTYQSIATAAVVSVVSGSTVGGLSTLVFFASNPSQTEGARATKAGVSVAIAF